MNTIKITEAELDRRIAELRGDNTVGFVSRIGARNSDGTIEHLGDIPYEQLPAYSADMNMAITLLDELPGAKRFTR